MEVGVIRVSEAVLESLERDSGSGEAVVIEWLYIPGGQGPACHGGAVGQLIKT